MFKTTLVVGGLSLLLSLSGSFGDPGAELCRIGPGRSMANVFFDAARKALSITDVLTILQN
jgi:hypothetical protein